MTRRQSTLQDYHNETTMRELTMRRPTLKAYIAAALISLATAAGSTLQAATNKPPVSIAIDQKSLVITGVTPGSQVIVFGRSCRNTGGRVRLIRHTFVERDDDRDGVVKIAMETIPEFSVFIAVDYESGEFASAAPGGSSPRVMAMPRVPQWREGSQSVDFNRGYLDFLFVRPGKGAWVLDILQGTARDDDGVIDGNLRLRIGSMKPLLGKDSPPPHATKKDVLAIIDPRDLSAVVMGAE